MSLNNMTKTKLINYLLQKIDEGDESVVRKTAEAFGLTPASVHRQLGRLEAEGIIRKIKRGEYAVVEQTESVELDRCKGEIESEDTIIRLYLDNWFNTLPDNVKRIWIYIASEMLNNIIDHSEAEHLRISLSHTPINTTLILSDDGIGIFEKIKNYFQLDSVDEAVGELYKGKITTDSARHSGEGIFFSSRMADSFIIISSGKVFSHNRIDVEKISEHNVNNPYHEMLHLKGTTFIIKLANNSVKTAKEVFDAFDDVEGSFQKTKILMHNFFDMDLASRSQAKRLCVGLEKFEEIVLDFDGIDWMAQGFAHQLFVVFQNEHPNIKIIPINTSEDVKHMINHVLN